MLLVRGRAVLNAAAGMGQPLTPVRTRSDHLQCTLSVANWRLSDFTVVREARKHSLQSRTIAYVIEKIPVGKVSCILSIQNAGHDESLPPVALGLFAFVLALALAPCVIKLKRQSVVIASLGFLNICWSSPTYISSTFNHWNTTYPDTTIFARKICVFSHTPSSESPPLV